MDKSDEYYKWHNTPNCKCVICGKPFYLKPYQLQRRKHGATCSKECRSKNRSIWFSGEGNHQYGLKEDKNASFKAWKRKNSHGYYIVHKKEHPFCDKEGFVLEHRLVVEENYQNYDSKYFVEVDGKYYLRKEFEVHHINEITTDNRPENLMILTHSEHKKLHCSKREIKRDSKGKIISCNKREDINVCKN